MARTNYAARRAQLISTFGVGSLFPAENNSFMITSIDQWDQKRLQTVAEVRLARNLRVRGFYLPPAGKTGRIPVIRFPDMLVCPKCNRLGNVKDLKARYDDPKCGVCSAPGELVPSRFVVACENGHLDDFPYSYWVHSHTPWIVTTINCPCSRRAGRHHWQILWCVAAVASPGPWLTPSIH